MAKVIFNPGSIECDANSNAKILAIAIRNKIDIRYGCASCSCGMCAIEISLSTPDSKVTEMEEDERKLLAKMGLDTQSGKVRLACRARILEGTVTVNLDFQNSYSPDENAIDYY
ncbi:MAG: 2Fe-2S iron-sulfur cluster binding domain-containing protein [Bdellovibrionota bacterium]